MAARSVRLLRAFLAHPIISGFIAGVSILFLTLWLTGSPPFDGGVERALCGNQKALGARPDLRRFGVMHVRGGVTIAEAPMVSPYVTWGGGNIDCEYFRLPLGRGQSIKIEWHKLTGGCCMHFYLWDPSVKDEDVARATADELRSRNPGLSLEVAEGGSTVNYNPPFSGRATLQVGDGNGTATDPYWFVVLAQTKVPRGAVTLIVDNRVTNGPTQMREDRKAIYLSTAPKTYCKDRGCAISRTERHSGGKYAPAVCQTFGEPTSNGDGGSPTDDHNPGLFSSRRYYGIRLAANKLGFVSDVWIRKSQRGGLGLPRCRSFG